MYRSEIKKTLFVDDRYVERNIGLKRKFHEPRKHPANPVIRADRPWEKDAAFVDTGLVFFDEAEGLFKAWYQGGACYGPRDGSHMGYAVSQDGIVWEKPSLGQVEFQGSKDNNILLMAECMMHDPAVIIDHHDDSNRRYKAIWWGGRRDSSQQNGWRLGRCVAFSPDGIHWQEHPANPIWVGDGEVTVPHGIEHAQGKFVAYCSADGYGMRVIARSESGDFLNWQNPPKLTFISDEQDVPGTEMAGIAAVDYYGTHLGMLWVIRNLPGFSSQEWREIINRNIKQGYFGWPIEMNNTRCRILYTELVTSIDGMNWHRVNRQPYLSFGGAGTWDECISLAGRPFVVNDRIYIYYTGHGRVKPTPDVKNEIIGKWNVETGLATLRLDGFASLVADPEGEFITKNFILTGTRLQLNIDASKGSAKVEILDSTGKIIPGFEADNARIIAGDQLRADVQWNQLVNVSRLVNQMVKIRVVMKNADLYSISILKD